MASIVVESVVPVMTCGRCGAASSQGQRFCSDCGVLLGRTVASAEYDALRGVAPAGTGAVVAARLIDVVVCLLGAAAGAALLFSAHTAVPGSDGPATAVAGAVVGVVGSAVIVAIRASRTGRGPGGVLVGTRVVDVDDALPVGPVRQLARLRRTDRSASRSGSGPWAAATGTLTASLRSGREPLSPSSPPLGTAFGAAASAGVRPGAATDPVTGGAAPVGSETTVRSGAGSSAVAAPAGPAPEDPPPAGAAVLRFDSGAVHWFHGTCVLGRNPEAEPGIATVAVPDLSRTLSKTHVALVQSVDVLVVRDLGSTNGTSVIRADGSFEDLVPGVDLAVPAGTRVRIGDHAFVVEQVGTPS